MDVNQAKQFVRDLIDTEFSAGFPFVRRVPSIQVWQTLVHVESLGHEDRGVLFDVLAERGCGWLQTNLDLKRYAERQKELTAHPAYQRFCIERTRAAPWKYADPGFMRQQLDGWRQVAARSPQPVAPPDFTPVPLAVVEAAEPPVLAKAAEIRMELKRGLSERYGAQPTRVGAGTWNYLGAYAGRPFTLTVDYGVRFSQLRYGLAAGRFPPSQPQVGGTWEDMLGLGSHGAWNFVCQHNLRQSVALLGEIVEKVVTLREQPS
jgi:hypothetical protein